MQIEVKAALQVSVIRTGGFKQDPIRMPGQGSDWCVTSHLLYALSRSTKSSEVSIAPRETFQQVESLHFCCHRPPRFPQCSIPVSSCFSQPFLQQHRAPCTSARWRGLHRAAGAAGTPQLLPCRRSPELCRLGKASAAGHSPIPIPIPGTRSLWAAHQMLRVSLGTRLFPVQPSFFSFPSLLEHLFPSSPISFPRRSDLWAAHPRGLGARCPVGQAWHPPRGTALPSAPRRRAPPRSSPGRTRRRRRRPAAGVPGAGRRQRGSSRGRAPPASALC